jgi:hypothetical protein
MPRFQFSLWWLMATITVVAVALFVYVTFGNLLDMLFASLVWCILPTPLVIFAIYSRGDLQSLAIGALIPWVVLVGLDSPAFNSYLRAALWLVPMGAICGVLAVVTRRWLEWNRWD